MVALESLIKTLKKLFPYNIVLIAAFFIPPLIASSMEDEARVMFLLLFSLLRINPSVSFFTAVVFGLKNGFRSVYPAMVGVWFLFAILIFFFASAFLLYLCIYIASAAAGCYLGSLFKERHDEMYL